MNKQEVMNSLTLEEKVRLLQAKDDWTLNGVAYLGVPEIVLTDGPSGVRMTINNMTETLPATAIPTESILSASWDTDLLTELWVDITNTGAVDGSEIVQIYVADPKSYLVRPEKELKGFARVTLKPQETKTIAVTLDERSFAYYVPHLRRYAVETGTFRILVGASSTDIRLQEEIRFDSVDDVRLPLGMFSTMGEFYEDDRYAQVTRQIFGQLQIGKEDILFPIISGITLNNLPDFLRFLQVPEDVAKGMQRAIINNNAQVICSSQRTVS